MTPHLNPSEFVDALECALDPRRRRHLDQCDRCQTTLTTLEESHAHAASGADVPEPSPLFWDHFSRRVRAAVDVLPPERQDGWRLGWRSMAIAAAVVVAVLLGISIRQPSPLVSGSTSEPGVSANAIANDEESLTFVSRVASDVSFDELQQAAHPGEDATDAMVAQLTPDQRKEFVRLLQSSSRPAERSAQ